MAKKADVQKAGKNGATKSGSAAAKGAEDMAAVRAEYNARLQREILPIPDIPPVGLTTYDAKDPDTKYPPIVPLRPPKGAGRPSVDGG